MGDGDFLYKDFNNNNDDDDDDNDDDDDGMIITSPQQIGTLPTELTGSGYSRRKFSHLF